MSKVKKNKLIKELEETLIKEGVKIDAISEVLKKIENNLKDKKYGLVWEEHTEEIEKELLTKIPILKEEKELRIEKEGSEESEDSKLTNNFLIEGDNLESLTALKNMGKKVDVIYIDPPYNTGNRDFIYEDRYVDSKDGFRHSKWLSFMEKRLKLARDLMTEEGVIFISIDDNEQANLKLLCDQVFGEQNFIANMVWKKKDAHGTDSRNISVSTEYVLCYSKNENNTNFTKVERELKGYNLSDKHVRTRGKYKLNKMDRGTLGYSTSLDFGITAPNGDEIYPNGRSTQKNDGWRWRWSEDKVRWGIENDFIEFKKGRNGRFSVYYKMYEKVDNTNTPMNRENVMPHSNLIPESVGGTVRGTSTIKEIMGNVAFNYAKPVSLISFLVKLHPYPNAIVLDFFAGSGTTGHAVLELNKEEGGNRNFILCTNNENNICRDVTYQRLNKVINGYTTPKGKEVEGIDANLTYLKTELVEKEDDLVDFEVSEELLEGMVNNLKVLHNISNTINLKEGRLTKLEGEAKDFYLYDNFYIDTNDFEGIELDSNKTNVVYVKEENLTDVVLNKFDEVIGLEDLLRY